MKPLNAFGRLAEAYTTVRATARRFFSNLDIIELFRKTQKKDDFHDWPPPLESLGDTSLTCTVERVHQKTIRDSPEHQADMSEGTDANSSTTWTPIPTPMEVVQTVVPPELAGWLPTPMDVVQIGNILELAGWPENLPMSLILETYASNNRFRPRQPVSPRPPPGFRRAYDPRLAMMERHAIENFRAEQIRNQPYLWVRPDMDNGPLTAPMSRELLGEIEMPIQPPDFIPEDTVEIGARRPGDVMIAQNEDNRPVTPPMRPLPTHPPVPNSPNRLEAFADQRQHPALRPPPPRRNQGEIQSRIPRPQPRPARPVRQAPTPAASPPTCLVCTESVPAKRASILPCGHVFCENCLAAGIRASLANMPFVPVRCCQRIGMSVIRSSLKTMPSDQLQAYRKRLSEFDDGEPLYCHDPTCSAFIPAALRSNNVAKCRRCHKKTCTLCRRAYHLRQCDYFASVEIPPDTYASIGTTGWRAEMARRRDAERRSQERQFRQLSRQSGWKPCPKCRTMIDKIDGCNHIHCTSCGTHFCYRCGQAPYDSHGPCAM